MAITTAVDAVYEVERQLIRKGYTPGSGKAGPCAEPVKGWYVELEAFAEACGWCGQTAPEKHIHQGIWWELERERFEVVGVVDRNGLYNDLAITAYSQIDAFDGLI